MRPTIMAAFPKLKTNAVTQYPGARTLRFQNQGIRFLDGTEQRYRDSAGALREWTLQLTDLDETEMAALERFFEAEQGAMGSFAFTDPWDGTNYPNCSLASDSIELVAAGELRGATAVRIVENRG
jgi:hypothetical protein